MGSGADPDPQSARGRLELDQIHADVAAAGEDFGTALVVSTMMVGPLVMLALVVGAAVRPVPRMLPVLVGAAVLTVGPIAYWWASFGPGLALADTYLISGGDYSPWAWPLVAVSVAAFLTLITIGVTWVRRSLAPAATAPA